MDIFPNLIGETEFKYFDEGTYSAMKGVLDEVTAKYLLDYINNPAALPDIVSAIKGNLGHTIDELTFHIVLKERGVVELVRNLSPESLPTVSIDLDELISSLTFLENNIDKVRTTIPARTSSGYHTFVDSMSCVMTRILMSGETPTYPDIMDRIKANKFLFYTTGEKDHSTGVGILSSKRRQWVVALNGARWMKYCNDSHVSQVERSKF